MTKDLLELLEPRRHLAAGFLDRNFSGDGRLPLPAEVRFTDLAAAGAGSVIVVGVSRGAQLANDDPVPLYVRKYRKTGTLDRSFATGGTFRLTLHAGVSPESAVPQIVAMADGRVLISFGNQVVRLRSSGDFDPRFSDDGIAAVAGVVRGIGADTDGHITLATAESVIRVRSNGRADWAFAENGQLTLPLTVGGESPLALQNAFGVTMAPNGDALVSGIAVQDGFVADRYAVARIRSDGVLDESWGDSTGIARLGETREGLPTAPILPADGSMLVGWTEDDAYVAIFRYSSSGLFIDRTDGFLPGGYYGEYVTEIAVQKDDKLVIAGRVGEAVNSDDETFGDNTAVERVQADLSPDTNFAGGFGTVIHHSSIDGSVSDFDGDGARALALTSDGDLVILSSVARFNNSDTFALARIDANGDAPPPAYVSGAGTLLVNGTDEDDRIVITLRDDGTTRVAVNFESLVVGSYRRVQVNVLKGVDLVELDVRKPASSSAPTSTIRLSD